MTGEVLINEPRFEAARNDLTLLQLANIETRVLGLEL